MAYNDSSGTNFYQPGEGEGGMQIDAVNLQTGQVLSTQTWASGGYELALPAGQYRVIASINDTVFQATNVTISNVNVEQDFVLTNSWQGGTRESAIAAAQPAPVLITPTPVPAPAPAPTPTPAAGSSASELTTDPAGVGRAAAEPADQHPDERPFAPGVKLVNLERQGPVT